MKQWFSFHTQHDVGRENWWFESDVQGADSGTLRFSKDCAFGEGNKSPIFGVDLKEKNLRYSQTNKQKYNQENRGMEATCILHLCFPKRKYHTIQ